MAETRWPEREAIAAWAHKYAHLFKEPPSEQVLLALEPGVVEARIDVQGWLIEARSEVIILKAEKDNAYRERNRCVAFIAQMALGIGWTVGQARHPEEDKDWDDDWRNIVFIDAPCGQLSWHFHDSEWEALGLDNLPQYLGKWDGHTTEEKYKRMEYSE